VSELVWGIKKEKCHRENRSRAVSIRGSHARSWEKRSIGARAKKQGSRRKSELTRLVRNYPSTPHRQRDLSEKKLSKRQNIKESPSISARRDPLKKARYDLEIKDGSDGLNSHHTEKPIELKAPYLV